MGALVSPPHLTSPQKRGCASHIIFSLPVLLFVAVCGLLMPAASRDAYFALRAFNAEVASIKDGHHVRSSSSSSGMAPPEPTSGVPPTFALQLRMQWWRNAVDAIYSADDDEDDDDNASSSKQRPDPSSLASSLSVSCWNSPVVRSLDRANAQIQWTRRFLERLLDARAADLELRQYDGVDDCAAYAEETVSSLLYLTLECTGVRDDAADSVASHAGIGVGLATLLRATPHRLAHGGGGGNEVPLPADLFRPDFPYHQLRQLQSHGARSSQNDDAVLTEADALLFRAAVAHVARLAARHLVEARERQGSVPSAGRVCLLPVIPALTYLSRLERADYNLFDPAVTAGSPTDRLKLLLRLGRTWATGIF